MSTEIAPAEAKITGKRQTTAWKTAKRVIFSHCKGEGRLRLVFNTGKQDAEHRDIEREIDFSVQSLVKEIGEVSIPAHDGFEPPKPLAEVASCHHSMWVDHGGNHGLYWRTICEFLKKDDVLSIFWGRNYDSNPNAKNQGLCQDRLALFVHRGEEKFVFIIPTPICKNDTARTIRRGPYNME